MLEICTVFDIYLVFSNNEAVISLDTVLPACSLCYFPCMHGLSREPLTCLERCSEFEAQPLPDTEQGYSSLLIDFLFQDEREVAQKLMCQDCPDSSGRPFAHCCCSSSFLA
jgi:hypothetical protein